MAHEAGKGSRPRPYSVDQSTFRNNWDSIFGKKKVEDSQPEILEGEEMWTQRVIDEQKDKDNG